MDETSQTYVIFWLYKVAQTWRHLPEFERAAHREQFASVLGARSADLTLRGTYSLVGLRHDADLLLWLHGPDLARAQDLAVALRKTQLGAYLEMVQAYSGVVPQSRYAPEHRPAFTKGAPPRRYLSMYPFVKTHDWYLLPFEERRALMAEHGRLGQPHSALPEVQVLNTAEQGAQGGTAVAEAPAPPRGAILTNTINSFGLGDQEFVVAFESDDAAALVAMVEALRAAEVRKYTALDTPIYLGRRKDVLEALADLG